MEINRQRFESHFKTTEIYKREVDIRKKDILEFSNTMNGYFNIVANDAWGMWQQAQKVAVPDGFVLVEKSKTEHWYLDEGEGLYMDDPGYWLCDLDIGEVQAVEHKEYLVTESNTLYATKVWDDKNKDVDSWQFFTSKDEAEKAAAHCKAKFWEEEAQGQVG